LLCGAISVRKSDDFGDGDNDSTAIDCRGVERTPIKPELVDEFLEAGGSTEAFDFSAFGPSEAGAGTGRGTGDAFGFIAFATEGAGAADGAVNVLGAGAGAGGADGDVLRGTTVSRDRVFSMIEDPDFITVVVVVVTVVVVVVDDLMGTPLIVFTIFGTLVNAAAAAAEPGESERGGSKESEEVRLQFKTKGFSGSGTKENVSCGSLGRSNRLAKERRVSLLNSD